jgi:hypothetical protein
LDYAHFERAVGAAENFARLAVDRGERAVVKIVHGEYEETRSFQPDHLRPLELRASEPLRSQAIASASRRF